MKPIQQLEQIANQWRSSKNNETAQDAVITAAREFLKRNLSDYEKDEVNDFYDFRANDSVGLLCFVDRHGKNFRRVKVKKFTKKDGSLTAYALACGYVEEETKNNESVRLYQENTAYCLRSSVAIDGVKYWCYHPGLETGAYGKASKQFKKIAKMIKKGE